MDHNKNGGIYGDSSRFNFGRQESEDLNIGVIHDHVHV